MKWIAHFKICLIDKLNISDYSAKDQLVLTTDGKVEAAILKNMMLIA